jgi:hypothetical protein
VCPVAIERRRCTCAAAVSDNLSVAWSWRRPCWVQETTVVEVDLTVNVSNDLTFAMNPHIPDRRLIVEREAGAQPALLHV